MGFAMSPILVSPALAAEPTAVVPCARNSKEVSHVSIALPAAVCATAGSVCTKATSIASQKDPKLKIKK